jgi:thioredoxin-related protein
VFSTKAFKQYAKKNLVLFAADFPRGKKLPEKVVAQNKELARSYGIQGFPTVLLVDANGKEIARTGYQEGGGEAYVKHLQELLKDFKAKPVKDDK